MIFPTDDFSFASSGARRGRKSIVDLDISAGARASGQKERLNGRFVSARGIGVALVIFRYQVDPTMSGSKV